MADVIHIDELQRTCVRCGFALPVAQFKPQFGHGRRLTCSACLPGETTFVHVAALAATGRLRADAIAALLEMHLTVAATRILAGARWPTLPQARAMQRAVSIPRPRRA